MAASRWDAQLLRHELCEQIDIIMNPSADAVSAPAPLHLPLEQQQHTQRLQRMVLLRGLRTKVWAVAIGCSTRGIRVDGLLQMVLLRGLRTKVGAVAWGRQGRWSVTRGSLLVRAGGL